MNILAYHNYDAGKKNENLILQVTWCLRLTFRLIQSEFWFRSWIKFVTQVSFHKLKTRKAPHYSPMCTKMLMYKHLIPKWKSFGCISLLGFANPFFRFLNQAGDFLFSSFAFWAIHSSKKWNQFKMIFLPEIYVDFINLDITPDRKNKKF